MPGKIIKWNMKIISTPIGEPGIVIPHKQDKVRHGWDASQHDNSTTQKSLRDR